MPDALFLILFIALLILALGLPLLVRPDSLAPDIVTLGILTAVVLGFAWGMVAWWILLPILALMAFVVWLERGDRQAPEDGNGWSDRITLRFRLWGAANLLQLVLIACVLAFSATGFGLTAVKPMIAWMVVTMVAAAAFRFSFYRACRHDRHTPTGGAMETVE